MKRIAVRFELATIVAFCTLSSVAAWADIYQWEYIDPTDPSLGKQPSTTLSPDGAGLDPVAGMDARYLDLAKAYLSGFDLTDAILQGTTLTEADLSGTSLAGVDFRFAKLDEADFANAEVHGSLFYYSTGFTSVQLYSTASYQAADLTGINLSISELVDWSFAGQNLTGASFRNSTLTGADFTDAEVRETNFSGSDGLTVEQLYSTASYQAGDLRGVNLDYRYQNLAGSSFDGQNLTNSSFVDTSLADVDLSGADIRGAIQGCGRTSCTNLEPPSSAVTENLIHSDGHVEGLEILAHDSMRLWDYSNQSLWDYDDKTPIPILVQQGMSIDSTGTLRVVFEDAEWGSTVAFEPSVPVSLDGTLELLIDDKVKWPSLVGTTFQLFDWTGVSPTGEFDALVVQSGTQWNTADLYTTGEVTLIQAVPEPSSVVLLGLVLIVPGFIQSCRVIE